MKFTYQGFLILIGKRVPNNLFKLKYLIKIKMKKTMAKINSIFEKAENLFAPSL
jgi:hypothetical protein